MVRECVYYTDRLLYFPSQDKDEPHLIVASLGGPDDSSVASLRVPGVDTEDNVIDPL